MVKYLTELQADNVGAVCNTLPADDTATSKAIASALSSSFGMGNSYFRIGASQLKEVDTVPFGCFQKSIFEKIGGFDEELIRNQDDEFNARIIKNGGRIYLIPNLVVDYYARNKISKVSRMFYQYGLFKPLVNKKLGSPATVRQFFPLLFVVGLIVGGLLSIPFAIIRYLYAAILLLYLLIALYFSMKEGIRNKDARLVFLLPCIFFTIHVSYGWGYLRGIYKILMKKPFAVQSNR